MSEWQPIETAIQDPTIEILGYISDPLWFYGRYVSVRWTGDYSGWSIRDISGPVSVSHWMPLPAPPDALLEKGGGKSDE